MWPCSQADCQQLGEIAGAPREPWSAGRPGTEVLSSTRGLGFLFWKFLYVFIIVNTFLLHIVEWLLAALFSHRRREFSMAEPFHSQKRIAAGLDSFGVSVLPWRLMVYPETMTRPEPNLINIILVLNPLQCLSQLDTTNSPCLCFVNLIISIKFHSKALTYRI